MADRVLIRGGSKESIPTLIARELGICLDTLELYVGTDEGNRLVGSNAWGEDIETLYTSLKSLQNTLSDSLDDINQALDKKLEASKATSVGVVAESATTEELATAFNSLISSLKTAGIMET